MAVLCFHRHSRIELSISRIPFSFPVPDRPLVTGVERQCVAFSSRLRHSLLEAGWGRQSAESRKQKIDTLRSLTPESGILFLASPTTVFPNHQSQIADGKCPNRCYLKPETWNLHFGILNVSSPTCHLPPIVFPFTLQDCPTTLAYLVGSVKRQEVRFGPILQKNSTKFTPAATEITEKRCRQRQRLIKQPIVIL